MKKEYKYNPELSKVKIREDQKEVLVPITSTAKPPIDERIVNKWQKLLNITADLLDIPSGLIMQLQQNSIKVFLKSNNEENPYERDEEAPLTIGLYCETVIGNRKKLMVENSLQNDLWKDNPDVELNMISYLGFPIEWPDKEVFGTICILDNKSNKYGDKYEKLLLSLKEVFEDDLKMLLEKANLEKIISHKDLLIREVHHRVKNNFNNIINFLKIKDFDISSNDGHELVSTISSRINSMSIIHEKLYKTTGNYDIDLISFIKEYFNNFKEINSGFDIALNIEGDDIKLEFDESIVAGLIINELFTNSKKYAFPQKKGTIFISIKDINENFFELLYRDDGIGISEDIDLNNLDSLGLQLIMNLPRQVDGSCKLEKGPDTSFQFILRKCPVKN